MTNVQDTVNQSMTSAFSLLHPIATMNTNPNLQTVFFDPAEGVALVGYRREVANLGSVLVRAQYGRDNEVKISHNNYMKNPVLLSYEREGQYIETEAGLPGKELNDGNLEGVNNAVALQKLIDVKEEVENQYEVGLNPGAIYKFLDGLQKNHKETTKDRKVNMMFTTDIVPKGHLLARPEVMPDGELAVMTTVVIKGKAHMVPLFVHESSKIHVTKLTPGMEYIVRPVSIDKQTGKRYADVLRPHYEGIRIAAQHFKMGIIKPGDAAYDVNVDPTNGLKARGIKNFAYHAAQKRSKIQGAPMMTIDLDVFYNLMKMFSAYPVVVMKFKNSTTGIHMEVRGNEYFPDIQAIVSPTVQHVRGRIWLP
ncbi:hypothetical protein [Priestia megaterium]|uniref:hypothetical protein n=1 Tax=Priestia megaterium TaxID=1404 RepID=UPI000BFCB7F6|nr:hypothetical protein [Priestia megaterium]PGQ88223.1 hypothetical protein COA18_04670 [Priestia megaterium]